MIRVAELLAELGALDADAIASVPRGIALGDVVRGLETVLAIFDAHWAKVGPRCPITEAELRAFAALADRAKLVLDAKASLAEPGEVTVAERDRALALLVDEYRRLRVVVSLLRWKEGDVDRFIPSAYPAKRKKPRAAPPVAPPAPVPG